jgi:hypothetical protein
MSRLSPPLLALVLGVGAVLGLSACGGGSGADLLPGTTAKQINANLDQVRAYVAEGDCVSAEDAVSEVIDEVDGLGGVDAKLKAALKEGTTRLSEVVADCESEEAEEETEPSIAPAVETQEVEADAKKEEKRLEKQAQAEVKPEGGSGSRKPEGGQNEGAPAPPANGKGGEEGGGAPPPAESSPSGGIGPGVQAGEG